MEMLNIGQQISSVYQNPKEKRSKISGGISKNTTEALSSVAASRDARDAKKLSKEVTFFFRPHMAYQKTKVIQITLIEIMPCFEKW